MSRRPVLIVIGLIIAVFGGLTATAGGALVAVFGRHSTVTSQPGRIATPTRAAVAKFDDLTGGYNMRSIPGDPRVRIRADGGSRELFIGVGSAADVDRYLSGVGYEEVTDLEFDPFRLDLHNHAGTGDPTPPAQQDFWIASASGTEPSLFWTMKSGSYRVVIMNADASAGVDSQARVAVTVSHVFGVAVTMLLVGVVALVGGITLAVVGSRRRAASLP